MRTPLTVLAAACCLVALASSVPAADLPDAGRLLRESTPPPTLAPPPKQPVIETPAEKPHAEPADGIRVPVSGFVYSGNTVFTSDELDRIMVPVVGRELTLAELEQAVERITRAYRSKGYFLGAASLPSQSIRPGQPVRVEIVEGTLEKINLKTSPPETRIGRSVLERYLSRLSVGAPVDTADLTETALLLNELPAVSTRVLLEPGREPGSTAATLEVTEGRRYGVSLFSDNYGNYATGYYRVGAGLELYSPFGLGERLVLRGNSSTSGDSQGAGASWSVPVSSSGTTIVLDYAWVGYGLGRSFARLEAEGDAHGFTLSIVQPLVRRSDLFVNAVVGGSGRLLEDRMKSVGIDGTRHTAGGFAGLSLYAADSLLGGGYSTATVTYSGGSLGVEDSGGDLLGTAGSYHKVSGGLSRSQAVYGDLALFAAFSGQWGSKNLDSSEQFSLGGPSAVRAYPVGEGSSDLGMITTLELRYPLPGRGLLPGRVVLSGLFDHGYGQLNAEPLPGAGRNLRHLYGAGFGVNWQWNDLAGLTSSVAWRLGEPPTSDGGTRPTVYLHLALRY